jgi:predicted permease
MLPVFAGVAAGHLLIRAGVATRDHGRFLFVFSFYVCLPALLFQAFAKAELTWQLASLPLAALLAVAGGYVVGSLVSRSLGLPPPQLAVFLMACMIVNTGFTLPFIQASLGEAGVVRLMAFDVVNGALVVTWVYTIAVRSNPAHADRQRSAVWRKLLTSPPLYAVCAGLVSNVTDLRPTEPVEQVIQFFGAPTAFLLTIGIGMLLVLERSDVRVSAWAFATRLGTSLVIGLALIAAFDLTGVERAVLLAVSVAPVGFNTVTFASLENLDLRLATGAASLSLVASLVLVPAVLLLAA